MTENGDPPVVIVERRSSGFGAFLGGAILGAVVALLYAPKSGEETKAELKGLYRSWFEARFRLAWLRWFGDPRGEAPGLSRRLGELQGAIGGKSQELAGLNRQLAGVMAAASWSTPRGRRGREVGGASSSRRTPTPGNSI